MTEIKRLAYVVPEFLCVASYGKERGGERERERERERNAVMSVTLLDSVTRSESPGPESSRGRDLEAAW